ncbi:MAG: UDP-N-acetylglucosamine 1-carboxyvinyltransferase [Oscillospiraceae bacterium]
MSKLIINGGNEVNGTIKIQGAKNSVLPILASCIITRNVSTIKNCPDLSDVDTTLKILKSLGCKIYVEYDTVTIDSRNIDKFNIDHNCSKEMRSSIIFLGALLSRSKKASMSLPGGCKLGKRPIDLHINSFSKMGAIIDVEGENLSAFCCDGLRGCDINLKFPSVGATENIMIAACGAEGRTVIKNVAKEPEIIDLANFLNSCGADIEGYGTETIIVNGVKNFNDTTYCIMPDRIETITYMAIAAVCKGKLTLTNTNYKDVKEMLPFFNKCGCTLNYNKNVISIESTSRLNNLGTIVTGPYPEFSTDAQPIFVAMMSTAKGQTKFVENIFENRFMYADEIKKMGCNIFVGDNIAVVDGVENLNASLVNSTDLRGGANLVVLACKTKGETIICDTHHIYRGYSNLVKNLQSIGVNIKEIS